MRRESLGLEISLNYAKNKRKKGYRVKVKESEYLKIKKTILKRFFVK